MENLSYKERIRLKADIERLISSRQLKIDSFKGDKNLNIHQLETKRKESDLKLSNLNKELKVINEVYTKSISNIQSKNAANDPFLIEFLKKNNTIQRNSIKKFFGIEKRFNQISNKDKKVLVPILEKDFEYKVSEKQGQIASAQKVNDSIKSSISHLKDIDDLNKLKMLGRSNEKMIKNLEKPIKSLIENIIDLDVKSIKDIMKSNTLSIEDILLYIKNLISNKVLKNGEKSSIDRLTDLEKSLEAIHKDKTVDRTRGVSVNKDMIPNKETSLDPIVRSKDSDIGMKDYSSVNTKKNVVYDNISSGFGGFEIKLKPGDEVFLKDHFKGVKTTMNQKEAFARGERVRIKDARNKDQNLVTKKYPNATIYFSKHNNNHIVISDSNISKAKVLSGSDTGKKTNISEKEAWKAAAKNINTRIQPVRAKLVTR